MNDTAWIDDTGGWCVQRTRPDGTLVWYREGKVHRDGGPAVIYADGWSAWYRDGKPHREDGPAVEDGAGYRWWYLDGRPYVTEDQWECELSARRRASRACWVKSARKR